MGELRSSHFHAGIDIKTGGQEGASVLATKSGYITRIKIATSGYGHALYMLHPDGNTSVYAHMKTFSPVLEKYVKEAQYKQQTYEIELFPDANQFSFNRGEELGKSGNTGGSTGPHLHFEIRDPEQKVLNPLHYGFQEIKDHIPPIAQKLALTPKNADSRINNQNQRKSFNLTREGFNYFIKDTLKAFGKIGLELLGHDKLDGAANQNGISIIEVLVNDSLYYSQKIDSMSFATQRHITVHYPYAVKMKEGNRYHRLYLANGNQLDFYYPTKNAGWLNIVTDSLYNITLNMYDPYENKSTLKFKIKGSTPDTVLYTNNTFEVDQIAYQIQENVLKVFSNTNCLQFNNTELSLKLSDKIVGIEPNYYLEKTAVYLWDLSNGLPESILSCGPGLTINEQVVYPKVNKTIQKDYMKVAFNPYSLFDTVYVTTAYGIESNDSLETFSIQPSIYPIKGSLEITLQPKLNYNHQKTAVFETNGEGDFSYVGGDWTTDNSIAFTSREFSTYTILKDTIPPTISRIPNSLRFIIHDDLSGIKSFKATLDNQWVLMKYEPKDQLIWVEWLNKSQPKSGEFKLIVTDNLGNEKSMIFNLK